jgi:tRNA1(Val) A37 N6-methylase TrmN6
LSTEPFAGRYDLIVGNPPYFFPAEGLPSKSELRNRCRFFRDGSFEDLFSGVAHSLKPGGRGFLLVKEGSKHGRRAFETVHRELESIASVAVVADVRGTHVVCVQKI